MREALSRVVAIPEEHEEDEELYDICRAYGLLTNAIGIGTSDEYETCSEKASPELLSVLIYAHIHAFNLIISSDEMSKICCILERLHCVKLFLVRVGNLVSISC